MSNSIQLRDASDITTYKKNRAIFQSYNILLTKNQLPIGGIPHEHLMAIARANDNFIPASSLLPTITATGPVTNTVSYRTSEIVANTCDSGCTSDIVYMKETYVNEIQNQNIS